ncbi:hypothetical protein AB4Y84_21835, partial [Stenotrophomonas sp. 2YAF22]|uniref:hypothetical protein n=1 Tax=Stenotrophomonas sp. 2YAF22 TaxID=3233028 RepID=UPI003F9B51B5
MPTLVGTVGILLWWGRLLVDRLSNSGLDVGRESSRLAVDSTQPVPPNRHHPPASAPAAHPCNPPEHPMSLAEFTLIDRIRARTVERDDIVLG